MVVYFVDIYGLLCPLSLLLMNSILVGREMLLNNIERFVMITKTIKKFIVNIKRKMQGVICFDFDGVIATYERPFKYNELGKPNYKVIKVMRYYYEKGYYILIFTGRIKTCKMENWLKQHHVPYNSFNTNPLPYPLTDNFKPYYNVIIDDKSINVHCKFNNKNSNQLIKEIDEILKNKDK